jgi:hypothetical protein
METKQFPIGNGPLETVELKVEIPGDWREMFYDVWVKIHNVLPQSLKSFTEESMNEYRKNYLQVLSEQSPSFKETLCSTYPLRLIYLDYKSVVYHASRWEEYRNCLIHEQGISHTIRTKRIDSAWYEDSEQIALYESIFDLKLVNVNTDFEIVDAGLTEGEITKLHNVNPDWRNLVQNKTPCQSEGKLYASCREFYAEKTKETLAQYGKYGMMHCMYDRLVEWDTVRDVKAVKKLLQSVTLVNISLQGDIFEDFNF